MPSLVSCLWFSMFDTLVPPRSSQHVRLGLVGASAPWSAHEHDVFVRQSRARADGPEKAPPLPRIVVGLDPGEHTGLAVYDESQRRLVVCTTTTFWGAVAVLVAAQRFDAAVVLEDPEGNRPTFAHGAASARQREKISQNVGMNKQHARLLAAACDLLGLPCLRLVPTKGSQTKTRPEAFAALTGYAGRTSSHARDAGMLCFDRTVHGVRTAISLTAAASPTP